MSPEVEAAIIAGSFGVVTVLATVGTQLYGFHRTTKDAREILKSLLKGQDKQLDTKLADQRDRLDKTLREQRTQSLNERFATAADKLGDSQPPAVRLAGVYAMAGLADDWKTNRQTCVDVLCAYLRLPYRPGPGHGSPADERLAFEASREVRHTVIRVITEHLRADALVPWRGLNFDFTGVVFDGGDFADAVFADGQVSFRDARFADGKVSFRKARFAGSTVNFFGAKFTGGEVSFREAKITGGKLNFNGAEVTDVGNVSFREAEFAGGTVNFIGASFSDGAVHFIRANFTDGEIHFDGASFAGTLINFYGAKFSGGKVDFNGARFYDGEIGFRAAEFKGGEVSFSEAEFNGGDVDFSETADWSQKPKFDWHKPPPGVKLPGRSAKNPARRPNAAPDQL